MNKTLPMINKQLMLDKISFLVLGSTTKNVVAENIGYSKDRNEELLFFS